MKTILLNRKCRQLVQFGIYAVRVVLADAVLCGVCGALYGMIFGGLGAKVHHDFSGMYSLVGTSGLVGCAIGTAVAIIREVRCTYESASTEAADRGTSAPHIAGETVIPFAKSSMGETAQNQKMTIVCKPLPKCRAISG